MAASWNFPLSSDFKSSVRFYVIKIVKRHSLTLGSYRHQSKRDDSRNTAIQHTTQIQLQWIGHFRATKYLCFNLRVRVQHLLYQNDFDLYENEPSGWTRFHMNGFARKFILTEAKRQIENDLFCYLQLSAQYEQRYTPYTFSKMNFLVNLKVEVVLFLWPLYGQTKPI